MDELRSNLEGNFSFLNGNNLNVKEEINDAVTQIDNFATRHQTKNKNYADHIAGM